MPTDHDSDSYDSDAYDSDPGELAPTVRTWRVAPNGQWGTAAPAGVDRVALHPPVDTSLIRLQRPREAHAEEFVAGALAAEGLARRWGLPPTTVEAYRTWIDAPADAKLERFLIRCAADGGLAGYVNVQEIAGGLLRSASLGYGGFLPYLGRGLMSAGVAAVVAHCFTALPLGLGLHRVEAAIQPANERSAALVRRLGFRFEGVSPRLMFIDGAWRDHDRYALTVEEWCD